MASSLATMHTAQYLNASPELYWCVCEANGLRVASCTDTLLAYGTLSETEAPNRCALSTKPNPKSEKAFQSVLRV